MALLQEVFCCVHDPEMHPAEIVPVKKNKCLRSSDLQDWAVVERRYDIAIHYFVTGRSISNDWPLYAHKMKRCSSDPHCHSAAGRKRNVKRKCQSFSKLLECLPDDVMQHIIQLCRPKKDFWAIRQTCRRFRDVVSICKPKGALPCDVASLVESTARFNYGKQHVPEFARAISLSHEYVGKNGFTQHEVGGPLTYRVVECAPVSLFRSHRYCAPCISPDLLLKKGSDLYSSLCVGRRVDLLAFIASQNDCLTTALRVCGVPPSWGTSITSIVDEPFARRCGIHERMSRTEWLDVASRGQRGRHCVRMFRCGKMTDEYGSELVFTSLRHIKKLLMAAVSTLSIDVIRWVRSNICNPRLYPSHKADNADLVNDGPFNLKRAQRRACLSTAMRMEYTQPDLPRFSEERESSVESMPVYLVGESLRVAADHPALEDRAIGVIMEIADWAGMCYWGSEPRERKQMTRGFIHIISQLLIRAIDELKHPADNRMQRRVALKSLVCISEKYNGVDNMPFVAPFLRAVVSAANNELIVVSLDHEELEAEAAHATKYGHSCAWFVEHVHLFMHQDS